MEERPELDLERAWPLFGLSAGYRDLLLREATDDDVLALAHVVEDGLVDAGNEHFVPRLLLGRAETLEDRVANFLRYHWGRRSAETPEQWDVAFAVLLDGRVVGSQSLHAREFSVLREVHTGSYLAGHVQGGGVGTRMRAMVLDLAFGYFGAEWATSGFVEGNERSRRVSARLGYEADGIELLGGTAAGEAVKSHRLRLSRQGWLDSRPAWLNDVTWTGVDASKTFLRI